MRVSNPTLIDCMDYPDDKTVMTDVTLRDLFAAFALAGIRANPDVDIQDADVASDAYAQADAMLAAREGKR